MIQADDFLDICLEFGLKTFSGTPCSYLKPFINRIIENEHIHFYPSTNEGDAVGFASGAWLAGAMTVVVFQNSGLGNAVNPITSLSQISEIPFLGIVTLRGEPGGAPDEPQHQLMGEITTALLDLMKIPWSYFPSDKKDLPDAVKKACEHMREKRTPYFFVMQKGVVEDYKLSKTNEAGGCELVRPLFDLRQGRSELASRYQALTIVHKTFSSVIPLIATTGKTGRELYEIEDHPRNFYMVGSMGCALSIGQGFATASKRPIGVIDGDGALMMRMGSMATSGILGDLPLFHLLLDNNCHDSTGGQSTESDKVSFATIASGCGYRQTFLIDDLDGLAKVIQEFQLKPTSVFVHMKIKKGSLEKLGRPAIHPRDVAIRFQKNFES